MYNPLETDRWSPSYDFVTEIHKTGHHSEQLIPNETHETGKETPWRLGFKEVTTENITVLGE